MSERDEPPTEVPEAPPPSGHPSEPTEPPDEGTSNPPRPATMPEREPPAAS